jgi:hypothetical protein
MRHDYAFLSEDRRHFLCTSNATPGSPAASNIRLSGSGTVLAVEVTFSGKSWTEAIVSCAPLSAPPKISNVIGYKPAAVFEGSVIVNSTPEELSPESRLKGKSLKNPLSSNINGEGTLKLNPFKNTVPPFVPGADTVATNETVDPAVTGCAGAFRLSPIVSANVREESSRVAATTNRANVESVRTVFFIMVDLP